MSTRHSSRQTARRPGPRPRRYTPYSLNRRALRIEPLEDRRLLAVVTVNTLSDTVDFNDGLTSLREAVFATNLVSGADTIDFAPSLTASGPATIVLTQGELKITDVLAVSGPGAGLLTIDANQLSRIFNITATTGDFRIDGLAMTGGKSVGDNLNANPVSVGTTFNGGAIRSLTQGTLTIVDSIVTQNSTEGLFARGGGIWAAGPVSLLDTHVVENHTSGDRSYGGGLSANGLITITASEINDNHTSGEGGFGGGVHAKNGLVISNSTISNNTASGRDSTGGGLYVEGQLTANNAVVENNKITGNVGFGGGIDARGSISLTDSIVSGNSTLGGNSHGGGINVTGGGTITRTTVSNNLVSKGNDGGGIRAAGTLTLIDSVISGNKVQGSALGLGGGIYSAGTLIVLNSTISGNSATAMAGGGIYAKNSLTLKNSTITKNQSRRGGGVWIASGSFTADNSIIAQNTASFSGADVFNQASQTNLSHSLIGNNSESSLAESPAGAPDASGNLIGGAAQGLIDPLLGPLADNGGPTKTHALLPGSPAINAGDLSLAAGVNGVPRFDQRGTPFSRIFNGRIDIGAFEYQQPSDLNLVVDTLVDESDGNYARGDLSLREAILLANTWSSVDTIHFDPALTAAGPATILLTLGELKITDSLTISGPGAGLLTIDASGSDPTPTKKMVDGIRIFNIDDGASTLVNVSVAGLKLTGGDVTIGGGAIRSFENLVVADVVITGNYGSDGGGISTFGVLRVENSVISGNLGSRAGGIFALGAVEIDRSVISDNRGNGIYTRDALQVDHSTISGNTTTQGGGGGIYSNPLPTNPKSLTIRDSSISNNSTSSGEGGGIRKRYGNLVIERSTISGNKAFSVGGAMSIADGTFSVQIVDSTISGNTAGFQLFSGVNGTREGGGIFATNGTIDLQVLRSTIADNRASQGGGILFQNGVWLSVDSSTISGNSSSQDGGGIVGFGEARVINSTVSGNTARRAGGGIQIQFGRLIIQSTTITGNSARVNGGGGIVVGKVEVYSSIIAANVGGDVIGTTGMFASLGYNAIGTSNAAAVFNQSGDQVGVLNPLLGPLADNGGPTKTHALLPGSPAINAGDPNAAAGVNGTPTYDQRGVSRTRVYGGRIDIGAFESQPDVLLGDYNSNGVVDTADFSVWRATLGSTTDLRADGNGDGRVDNADYALWRSNLGQSQQVATEPLFTPAVRRSGPVYVTADVTTPVGRVIDPASAASGPPIYADTVGDIPSTTKASLPSLPRRLTAVKPASTGLLAWLFDGDRAQTAQQRTAFKPYARDVAFDDTSASCDDETAALDEAFATL